MVEGVGCDIWGLFGGSYVCVYIYICVYVCVYVLGYRGSYRVSGF